MSDSRLKVVICDDNDRKFIEISKVLPDYMNAVFVKISEEAKEEICVDGIAKTDLVILNSDDIKGESLNIFGWMKTPENGVPFIPTVVLTKDAFCERALSFYDYDDALFYEGKIDEDKLYSVVMEALDEAEGKEMEETVLPLYTGEKSPDKVMGMSYNIPSVPQVVQRTALLSGSEVLSSIKSSIDKGLVKAEEVKDIIYKAIEEKEKNGEEIIWTPKPQEEREPVQISYTERKIPIADYVKRFDDSSSNNGGKSKTSQLHDLDDPQKVIALLKGLKAINEKKQAEKKIEEIRAKVLKQAQTYVNMNRQMPGNQNTNNAQGANTNTMGYPNMMYGYGSAPQNINPANPLYNNQRFQNDFFNVSQLGSQVLNSSFNNQMIDNTPKDEQGKPDKWRVLIIDPDSKTLKACQLFAAENYIYEYVENAMKAIDYLVQNRPDIILIEYDMQGLNGYQIMKSIRRQANGTDVPAIVMVRDKEESKIEEIMSNKMFVTVINKPIEKKSLRSALDNVSSLIQGVL